MLSKLPRPEPILTVKVDGSDIRLCYRDIVSAEHFAHMIGIRTTAGKTLATRQSFKAFTEPLKKTLGFRLRSRCNRQYGERCRFSGCRLLYDGRQPHLCQSELLKAARQAFMEFLLQRGRVG